MFSSEANFDGAKLYYNSVVSATISLMLGGILAPVFYLFVQGITQRWINPFIIKVISYKNYKSEHMEKLSKTTPVNKIEQKISSILFYLLLRIIWNKKIILY